MTRLLVSAVSMLVRVHAESEIHHLLDRGVLALGQALLRVTGDAIGEARGSITPRSDNVTDISIFMREEDKRVDHLLSAFHLSPAEQLKHMTVGTRVVRGADWKWSNQV